MRSWQLAVAIAAVPSAAMAQDRPSPHDVTTYPVVYRVPGCRT